MAMRSKMWTRRLWILPVVFLFAAVIAWNVEVVSSQSSEDLPPGDTPDETSNDPPPLISDLDPKGNCSEEIKKFCTKKSVIALDCISEELMHEEAPTNTHDDVKVSKSCKQEWRALKISQYKDLSLSKKIEDACKIDIEKTCSDGGFEDGFRAGGVLACLRKAKDDLSQSCQDEILVAEQDAVNDFKMDPLLSQKCSDDAAKFCKGITPGGGRIQTCLMIGCNVLPSLTHCYSSHFPAVRNHTGSISYSCQAELFRQEAENAGDLRLNIKLYNACSNDRNRFCPTVHPGNSRLKECLESKRLEPDFSASCKVEFDKMLARRSADFRLNPALKEKCRGDINMICNTVFEDVSEVANQEPRIIHCLQDYEEDLNSTECKDEVHRLLTLAAEDYRFDKKFADSCEASKQKVCKDVENDKVLSCLQSHREKLDNPCRAAVFEMEWRLSGDIDYKFAMKQACGVETGKFCHGLRHDRGAIIECLQRSVDDPEMGADCKKEIVADQLESAKDYRLNYRIYKDCKNDVETVCKIPQFCTGFKPCGGVVLGCLQDNLNHLASEECRKDIISFEIKESKNLELNIPFQKACYSDLTKYCIRMSRDNSKALTCLRAQRSKLTKECKEAELRFSMMEASDVRFTPSLMNACGTELGTFCTNVVSLNNGEAFKCLQLNLESLNMGAACKVEVDLQGARQASDYRLDVRVRTECKDDVKKFCSSVDKKEDGHASVLKCFVEQYRNLSVGCQTEVSYAVRMALWQYKFDSDLTLPCDEVVKKYCNTTETKSIQDFFIGSFGQCLITQRRRSLNPSCRSLVRVATRNGLFTGNVTDDIAAALKKYNELTDADDFSHSGIGFFWVATVVAFVAILAVALFRRYAGPPRTYTLVVKGGDL